jgi:hypothetical protein
VKTFTDDRPVAYQTVNGRRETVDVRYDLKAENAQYGFHLGEFDQTLPLVIDPAVVIYAAYVGGSDNENARAVAVGSDGSAYLTGTTLSTDLPV